MRLIPSRKYDAWYNSAKVERVYYKLRLLFEKLSYIIILSFEKLNHQFSDKQLTKVVDQRELLANRDYGLNDIPHPLKGYISIGDVGCITLDVGKGELLWDFLMMLRKRQRLKSQ